MTPIQSVLLAIVGTGLTAGGGFIVGRWWYGRVVDRLSQRTEAQIRNALAQVLERYEVESDLARAIDPLAGRGRGALTLILEKIQDTGGFTAVVLSDEAGLVVAGRGPDELVELIAVEAAAFGNTSERIQGQRQTILQTQPDKRWTLHRYFEVEPSKLCVSARRHGGTPRAEALDGTLAAFERILSSGAQSAA